MVDPAVESRLEAGAELSQLVSALTRGEGIDAARAALVNTAGDRAAAAATAVCANFQMMNRVVDATGLPAPAPDHRLRQQLGLQEQ